MSEMKILNITNVFIERLASEAPHVRMLEDSKRQLLQHQLVEVCKAAAAAWPQIKLDVEAFVFELACRFAAIQQKRHPQESARIPSELKPVSAKNHCEIGNFSAAPVKNSARIPSKRKPASAENRGEFGDFSPLPVAWSIDSAITWLQKINASDLLLAMACENGDEIAIRTFERVYESDLRHITRRFASARHSAEELVQTIWLKLFVRSEDRPGKIAEYLGQGSLRSWLRITAMRTSIDLTKAGSIRELHEEEFRLPDPGDDPELMFLKRKYRAHFKQAFGEAFARLEPRQRVILRQYHIAGLTIDQLATLYSIHRASSARRVAKARQALFSGIRQRLKSMLDIDNAEFESIINLIHSQLEISMNQMLSVPKP